MKTKILCYISFQSTFNSRPSRQLWPKHKLHFQVEWSHHEENQSPFFSPVTNVIFLPRTLLKLLADSPNEPSACFYCYRYEIVVYIAAK